MSTKKNTSEKSVAPYQYKLGNIILDAYILESPVEGYAAIAVSNFGHWRPRIVPISSLKKVNS